ncbi:hypothetical protein TWF694_002094 [Orbilia ellipsospora]|uniref:Uncharacterized protein n=1 Tax=Orbilia ellipsospora TaxID=2528407 RepID=A0AAV9X5N1_9PEZI
METLIQVVPGMPLEIASKRAMSLQEIKNQMSIVRYGDVITYKKPPISSPVSPTSSEQSSPCTIIAESPGDQTLEWSPSKPSPQTRPKNPHFSLSDLDGVIISDNYPNDVKGEIEKEIPQTALALSKSHPENPNQKRDNVKGTKLPRSAKPKRGHPISPHSALKQENAPQKSASKIPATTTPMIAPQSSNTSPTDGFGSSPGSGETSPIRRLLNNKASRLRTKSNLSKISCYEDPKPHLNFNFGSPPKSPVAQRLRDSKEEDAAATYELIDAYFQNRVSDGEKGFCAGDGESGGTDNDDDIPLSSPMQTPPVTIQESPRQYGNLGPSSLRFPMDEETQIQLASEQNLTGSLVDKYDGVSAQTAVPENSEHLLAELISQYVLRPQPGHGKTAGSTKIKVSESKDAFKPTILTLKIGRGGLVVNLECTGDEIFERVQ